MNNFMDSYLAKHEAAGRHEVIDSDDSDDGES